MTVRRLAVGAAFAVLVAALAVPGAGGAKKPVVPARVQVVAEEFSLTLSRRTIKAGPAVIELANFGQDAHDLVMRRSARGARTYRVKETLPEHQRVIRATVVPGRYLLWCSIADHRQRGMQVWLTVKKR